MVAIASLVFILFLSLIVVRVAAVALTLTGMSREVARFQARSAWTGTGFTTAESEQVVSHPARREIISFLILLRNAGFVTAASALVLSFVGVENTTEGWPRLGALMLGLVALRLRGEKRLDRQLDVESHRLDAEAVYFYRYPRLCWTYSIWRANTASRSLKVKAGDGLAGETLKRLKLPDEGVLVLGIARSGGEFLGAPHGDTEVHEGDVMLLYGRSSTLKHIDRRRADFAGAEDRREAVERQRDIEAEERRSEERAGEGPAANNDDRTARTGHDD